jgi:lipopolysaccharide export system ATP-binding protein
MSVALGVEELHVTIGAQAIVSNVSFEVSAGRVVAVLGPSGAGKSSLFRAIVGETRARSGRVSIDGVDVSGWPLWRRARAGLGYLPQGSSVLPDLTVAQNVATFARLLDRSIAEVDPWIDALDLRSRVGVRASALSGGERRRLELLRVMAHAPRVVVCDEPFTGVDPASVAKVAALIRALAIDRGVAVVVSDHRVADALAIADEALLLVDGRVEARCLPREFKADRRVRAIYLGDLDERA